MTIQPEKEIPLKRLETTNNFTELVTANNFQFWKYIPTGDYLFFISSSSPDPYQENMDKLYTAMTIIRDDDNKKAKVFIADMNGGGNPDFASLFALCIYPELFPIFNKF